MLRASLAALAALILCTAAAPAQPGGLLGKPLGNPAGASKLHKKFLALGDVIVSVVPAKVKRGETITISLTVEIKEGATAHTYPFFTTEPDGKQNRFALSSNELTVLPGATDPPGFKLKPQKEMEPNGPKDRVYDKTTTWEIKATVSPTATPGKKNIDLGRTLVQICGRPNPDTNDYCITADLDELPHLKFEVTDDPPVAAPANPVAPTVPKTTRETAVVLGGPVAGAAAMLAALIGLLLVIFVGLQFHFSIGGEL